MEETSKPHLKVLQLILGVVIALFLLLYFTKPLSAQAVGGACEGCEAALEYGQKVLTSIDTLPEFESHEQQMLIKGTVFQKDGSTPAAGVIIYAYHTNEKGIYPTKGDETGYGRYHGYLRGWARTDERGQYQFYTFKPATYPNRSAPAHVHITVKEPGLPPYWIDSIEFEEDPLVTSAYRKGKGQRAGSGIVRLREGANGLLLCKRDIVLGKNITNYPR